MLIYSLFRRMFHSLALTERSRAGVHVTCSTRASAHPCVLCKKHLEKYCTKKIFLSSKHEIKTENRTVVIIENFYIDKKHYGFYYGCLPNYLIS